MTTEEQLLDALRQLAALNAVVAGRDRPPTLLEVSAHEERGGDWIYQIHDDPDCVGAPSPEVWYIVATADDTFYVCVDGKSQTFTELPNEGRWWCWSGGIVAWPEVVP